MFFIVTAHPDTAEKAKVLTKFSKELHKESSSGTAMCYCTHYPKIPDYVSKTYDHIVYTKDNPLLNWDIRDDVTRRFGSSLNSSVFNIMYPQIYHGYAHIMSVCDGIILGANLGYTQFTMMNYDLTHKVFDLIPKHIETLKEYNGVFYYYNNDKLLNTEFFSFDLAFALELFKLRDYNNYKKYDTVLIEKIFQKLIIEKSFKIFASTIPFEGRDNFGEIHFGGKANTLVIPYHEKKIDGKKFKIMLLPYKKENQFYVMFGPSTENTIHDENFFGLEVFLNDDKVTLSQENITSKPVKINDVIKVYDNKKLVREMLMNDERQFGSYYENGVLL